MRLLLSLYVGGGWDFIGFYKIVKINVNRIKLFSVKIKEVFETEENEILEMYDENN